MSSLWATIHICTRSKHMQPSWSHLLILMDYKYKRLYFSCSRKFSKKHDHLTFLHIRLNPFSSNNTALVSNMILPKGKILAFTSSPEFHSLAQITLSIVLCLEKIYLLSTIILSIHVLTISVSLSGLYTFLNISL